MGRSVIDMSNQRYGRLLALCWDGKPGRARWLCRCDCGNEVNVLADSLRGGRTKSCGCLQKEVASKANATHGLAGTPEYNIWRSVKHRCENPADPAYKNYGGRGIALSEGWANSFETFLRDMGFRPSTKHSLDRIDNNGPYTKENCRWATRSEQQRNRRGNRLATINGITKCLTEWCEHLQISVNSVRWRMRKGMSPHEALTYKVCPV